MHARTVNGTPKTRPPCLEELPELLPGRQEQVWPPETQYRWYWTVPKKDRREHGPYTSQQMNVWATQGQTPGNPVRFWVQLSGWK